MPVPSTLHIGRDDCSAKRDCVGREEEVIASGVL